MTRGPFFLRLPPPSPCHPPKGEEGETRKVSLAHANAIACRIATAHSSKWSLKRLAEAPRAVDQLQTSGRLARPPVPCPGGAGETHETGPGTDRQTDGRSGHGHGPSIIEASPDPARCSLLPLRTRARTHARPASATGLAWGRDHRRGGARVLHASHGHGSPLRGILPTNLAAGCWPLAAGWPSPGFASNAPYYDHLASKQAAGLASPRLASVPFPQGSSCRNVACTTHCLPPWKRTATRRTPSTSAAVPPPSALSPLRASPTTAQRLRPRLRRVSGNSVEQQPASSSRPATADGP